MSRSTIWMWFWFTGLSGLFWLDERFPDAGNIIGALYLFVLIPLSILIPIFAHRPLSRWRLIAELSKFERGVLEFVVIGWAIGLFMVTLEMTQV